MKRALLPCKLPDQNGTKTAKNTSRRPVQGAPLWIPAFAGMTKKDQSPRSHRFPPFLQNALRHSCKTLAAIPAKRSRHSCKTLSVIPAKRSPPFLQNTLRHSREGGNPLSITVIHTGVRFLNQPNLPCLPIFSGDSM